MSRRCQATLADSLRCTSKRSGSRATCTPCRARIVDGMHGIMRRYGLETADLVTHWKRYHAQDVTCPECFTAAHARLHARLRAGQKASPPRLIFVTI